MGINWDTDPRKEVYFWPGSDSVNDGNIYDRAAVIFDSALVADPLDKSEPHEHWRSTDDTKPPAAFKLIPSDFLRRAQAMPPENPQATVSAFSQWIYSLYSSAYGDDEDRERGTAMEQEILDRRKKAPCCINNDFLRSIRSDWMLVHNGMHLPDGEHADYFRSNHLNVNGEPLRASPDLLYCNEVSSEVIIVEIKFSRLPITTNLWPNVWAQLWCYSQLEIPRSAQKLTVIGEVWGERWTRRRWRSLGDGIGTREQIGGKPLLCLRASVRRDPRAPAYDRFFRKLFDIYCGSL